MEQPWGAGAETLPEADERRLVTTGLDGADRRVLEGMLRVLLGATGARLVERPDPAEALEEARRSREAGALPALLVGAAAAEREIARLARGLGNHRGSVPVVVWLPAPLTERAEAALAEGCCEILVRGRTAADDLVRAMRHAFEVARRERAEERLRLRLLEPTAPAPLLADARRFVALGRTLAAVCHDLNNLLLPIQGFAELVREGGGPAALHGQQIERAVGLARDLVGSLLAASRNAPPVVARTVADRRLSELAPLIRHLLGSGLGLELELSAAGVEVELRAGVLEQVVLNLASNSRDAMAPGGVLRLRSASEGTCWRLEVEDSGAGIADDCQSRVFEPGYSTKRPEQGSGLGLWIVRGLVEEAGGRVALESAGGLGTRVTVRLPLAGAAR
jgi:signal transduction histidine kinase